MPILRIHRARSAPAPARARRGAGSVQVGRRLHALYDHPLAELDEPAWPRIQLERRLLDAAFARSFPDPEDRAIAAHPDRLGLGAGDSA